MAQLSVYAASILQFRLLVQLFAKTQKIAKIIRRGIAILG